MTSHISILLGSYSVQRVATAGFSFATLLLGARMLPADVYAIILQTAFLAKFLQIMNFGAVSGYLVSRYSNQAPFEGRDDLMSEGAFVSAYMLQLLVLCIILGLGSLILVPEYGYAHGFLTFGLMIPILALEPCLRYRRMFFVSLIPDFLLSIALLLAIVYWWLFQTDTALMALYHIVLGGITICIIHAFWTRREANKITLTAPWAWAKHMAVLKHGLAVYVASALFLVASSLDRLSLPAFATPQDINTYFLAWQLTVGSMIFLVSVNFVNTIDLGQARQSSSQLNTVLIRQKLLISAAIGAASLVALICGTWMLVQFFLPDTFANLTRIVTIMGAGLAIFYLSNTVTPIMAYIGQQRVLSWAMAGAALVIGLNNVFVYLNTLSLWWLIWGTSITLAGYAIFALICVFRAVHRNQVADDTAQIPNSTN